MYLFITQTLYICAEMFLKELVNIRTGSPELSENYGKQIKMVRMKAINHDLGIVDWDLAENVFEGSRLVKKLVANEILIVAKGERNTAALVDDVHFEATASNHLFILTLHSTWISQVEPRFLVWYLNHPAKEYFETNSTGAVIPNLRKETLGNLQIFLPTLNEQKWIVEVYDVMKRQKEVFNELFKDRINLLIHHVSRTK